MTAVESEVLLTKVALLITKTDTRMGLAITAQKRLAITLRFLAHQHISIQPAAHSGSTFRNFKCRFAVQMMDVVDAAYQFRYVSVGAQGKAPDAGIFAQMDFKRALDQGLLNIPSAKLLPGSATEALLMIWEMMHTLSVVISFCQMDHDQRVFNYSLANQWRVFCTTIMLKPDKVVKIKIKRMAQHS